MTASPEGKLTYFNRKAEELFGYSRDEVLGKSYKILHVEDRLDQVESYFKQITKGRDLVDTEIPCVTKDGRVFTVSISTTSVTDSTEKTTLIAIAQDVTDSVPRA